MSDKKATIKAEGAGGTVTEGKVDSGEDKTKKNKVNNPVEAKILSDFVKTIPSLRGEIGKQNFENWLNDPKNNHIIQKIWNNTDTEEYNAARKKILAKLRNPGGYHEWMMVSRANIFVGWGVGGNINKIGYKTLTTGVCFNFLEDYVIKDDKENKYPHCSSESQSNTGTTTAHVDILKIIEKSKKVGDYKKYREDLKKWANGNKKCVKEYNMRTKLNGGVTNLPEQLKI